MVAKGISYIIYRVKKIEGDVAIKLGEAIQNCQILTSFSLTIT